MRELRLAPRQGETGVSVSKACLDTACPSPSYPWQNKCLRWQKGKSWWKRGRREERIETPGRELRRKERRKKGRKEQAGGNDGRKREAGKGKRVSKHWRGKTKRQKIEQTEGETMGKLKQCRQKVCESKGLTLSPLHQGVTPYTPLSR